MGVDTKSVWVKDLDDGFHEQVLWQSSCGSFQVGGEDLPPLGVALLMKHGDRCVRLHAEGGYEFVAMDTWLDIVNTTVSGTRNGQF